MKKIININLAGRLIAIEDSAYEILRQYLDSLTRYFAREEGGDEIVSDIESRIAELFLDRLKTTHCITDEDVQSVKAAMGTPEQFEEAGEPGQQRQPANDPVYDSVRPRKRLYRDPDAKVLGGVCGGLGAYLNVDPVVFRIIFALLAIGGFGSGILVYFILWVVTPEANTSAEKLQMRGEKVDVNNIRATVQDELNAAKSHLKTFGNDVKNFSTGRGRQFGSDIERIFRNLFGGLGKVLLLLTKGFFYFLAVVILLALIAVGVGITVSSAALFPLKNLILAGPLQNLLLWVSILFLIGIPIVALIIFFVRKATGIKEANRYVGYTLSLLWFAGLISAVVLIVSVIKDFRTGSTPIKEKFALVQPSGGKLVIKQAEDFTGIDEIEFFDDILRVAEDTVIINTARIKVEKSDTDSFEVYVERYSRGRRVSQARELAREIQYQIVQKDSILYVPNGISIPTNSKFRGQHVRVIVKVPANKHIVMDKNLHYYNNHWDYDNDNDWDEWGHYREKGQVEFKMNENGFPEDLNEEHKSDSGNNSTHENKADSLERNYRYKGGKQENKTPVEDSGSDKTPAAQHSEVALDGMTVIAYSFYKLIK
ncbi:PspC domain-containing protein [Chitinophaga sp. CF418]|uniref:PspC domain-containing protein n=1 Tax=Chitinophaga sp. CF418 TaxID=1855287 RepID=UPI00091DC0B9|nr:PspC domain-containing protein [Chitinophaga sp. CF418]SHM45460.1 phage shock protein C (PspC) family protein [Chitinophaga sp. CF418]